MAESTDVSSGEVEEVPLMVGSGTWCDRNKAFLYDEVDYKGDRFRVGDHVAVHAGDEKEEFCSIESLYQFPDGVPTFKGKWFWQLHDILNLKIPSLSKMKASVDEQRELVLGDVNDSNTVDVITKKITVVSLKQFQKIRPRLQGTAMPIYYCDRMYISKTEVVRKLRSGSFREDTLPQELKTEIKPTPVPVEDTVKEDKKINPIKRQKHNSVWDVDAQFPDQCTSQSVGLMATPDDKKAICIDVDADIPDVAQDVSRVFDVDDDRYCE